MRVLDSHLHLWDPSRLDYPWLEGPLLARLSVDELQAVAGPADADRGFVFVQADCREDQYLEEVDWVASIAGRVNVRGIVAGARLDRDAGAVERHLDALAARPLVVGVRHLLQGEHGGFAASAAFRRGAAALAARGLSFDACVRGTAQLRDVVGLARALPELRIVLDHVGKPAVGTASAPRPADPEWSRLLHELGERPNVSCKLSGLPAEAGGEWSAAQLAPFLDAALSAFGAERMLFGSDWPVSALVVQRQALDEHAYRAWRDTVADWARDRAVDADAVLWRNAERVYGLN